MVGWTREGKVLFLIVGAIFLLYGLKALLLDRPKTHRFERWRGMLAIDSKGLRNERSAPSDYLYFVTKQGERIRWADSYDGSKERLLECLEAGREFLGLVPQPSGP